MSNNSDMRRLASNIATSRSLVQKMSDRSDSEAAKATARKLMGLLDRAEWQLYDLHCILSGIDPDQEGMARPK